MPSNPILEGLGGNLILQGYEPFVLVTPPIVPLPTPWRVNVLTDDRAMYITPDGKEYWFSPPTFIIQDDGHGMPPLEYVTERGPFQHGESVKDVFLRPRTIQMVVRRNGCSRAEFWNIRNTLLDILRPSRMANSRPGTLRKYLANGTVREISVFTSEGPGFPSHDPGVWDQWSVQDTIRFTAYDPIYRDPKLQIAKYAASGSVGGFPITFPLTIASFGSGSQDIEYAGTWLTYPSIVLNGPLTGPIIRNATTGEKIQFNYTLATGRTATIDLTYGFKTVTLDDGTNLIGYLSSDSDVATFHLTPGHNAMQILATGTSQISSIQLQWYNKFIGI